MNKINLSLSLDAFKALRGIYKNSKKIGVGDATKVELQLAFAETCNQYESILIDNIVHYAPSKVREDLIELLTPIAGKQGYDGVLESLLMSLEQQIDEDELEAFEHEMLRDFENEIR